jgi:hypothetical protein
MDSTHGGEGEAAAVFQRIAKAKTTRIVTAPQCWRGAAGATGEKFLPCPLAAPPSSPSWPRSATATWRPTRSTCPSRDPSPPPALGAPDRRRLRLGDRPRHPPRRLPAKKVAGTATITRQVLTAARPPCEAWGITPSFWSASRARSALGGSPRSAPNTWKS